MAHHDSHSHNGGAHLHAEPGTYHHIPVQDHSTDLGHVSPVTTYYYIFGALLVLTAITVGVTRFDFGTLNIVVALVIASAKAMLVALYFMHLKYEKFTTWVYAAFPLFLLALMIGGVFIDNPFRAVPTPVGQEQQLSHPNPEAQKANLGDHH